ncbi:MAG TPA: Nif3-like dinuclear metal center hexameric protein [Phnomibacter sp.]|nr:Nif3-like dinuclear metal center hexameric protein [Phnomibacter sp.]
MTFIRSIIDTLTDLAHPSLQESYDNTGLLTGDPAWPCTGVLCTLDVTEDVVNEAILEQTNLIVAHHPLILRQLKTLVPGTAVERTLVKAIKHDIAIYAIHTNYDNVHHGVNLALARTLGLSPSDLKVLAPMGGKLAKLYTYVPAQYAEQVKTALFAAGAGRIGLYAECGFETSGKGSFRPGEGSDPFIGRAGGPRETVDELKIEVIFPIWLKNRVLNALKTAHPYEEVAYEVLLTENEHQEVGAGMIGNLPETMSEMDWLNHVKEKLGIPVLRHSALTGNPVKKVAICGGAGAFLQKKALQAGADTFLTADLKYHDFFEPEGRMLLMDIGHGESERGAMTQLCQFLHEKFPTFAVLQTKVDTNPVRYFKG